ncbi:LysR family transcriptional regulator [Rhizobium bangladeshense]|uniref:LysR family transcriptional regulator n=1 Tax=Rhizobium bangladeshense TaxID=1138189 RepID=UPI001C8393EE|nr:LysR family transcriptional regulator [Rhizobium bangladeshense]MBX4920698.1 LysR family transcriptional regulator [Rhizobium bangladeshense]
MTEPINVDDLRFLLSVAETGSTLSASKALKVSQSTVSRRIAALEADLCIQLFDKRRTGYVLTEAGAALIAPAQVVRQAVDAFSSAVGSLSREISGAVRFTTNDVLANMLLTDLTMRLKQVHPGVRLEADISNLLRNLANGEADVALRAAPAPTEAGLVGLKLVEDYWSLYCSRSYAERNGVPKSAEELYAHALVGIDPHVRDRPIFEWARQHFPPETVLLRQNSVPAVFASVRNGLGIGFYSEFIAAGDPELVLCFRPPVPPAAEIWLVTHERLRHVPRIRAVMDAIKALVKERAGRGLGKERKQLPEDYNRRDQQDSKERAARPMMPPR